MSRGVINILMDSTSPGTLSYDEVEHAVINNIDYIETNCLSFFDFKMLDRHYDVVVHRFNGTIVLSALLDDNPYTNEVITADDDVHKMLISSQLNFMGL